MKMNKKGFTLIELLAVIVILGVLLGIAIPSMTKYITSSRKEGYISSASIFLDTVRNDLVNEIYPSPIRSSDVVVVTFDQANLRKSEEKSSFGGKYLYNKSYVAVVNVGTGTDPEYRYYVSSQDTKNYAIPLTEESKLNSDVIVSNAKNKMEVTILSLCGSPEGSTQSLYTISGLEDIQPVDEDGNKISWNATIYSSESCGTNGNE